MFFRFFVVSKQLCVDIGKLRRRFQRIRKDQLIFLDETNYKLNQTSRSTLVAPGEKAYGIIAENTSYASRYDMIAACVGDRTFPPKIITPKDREQLGVRGITKEILNEYISNILAQACGSLDQYPLYLVCDRSTVHNEKEMLDLFHFNGCQDMKQIIRMPPDAAKRISPLDNSLFGDWKRRVRLHDRVAKKNIVRIMSDEWNNISTDHIYHYYQHCGLVGRRDPYFDCPLPREHQH